MTIHERCLHGKPLLCQTNKSIMQIDRIPYIRLFKRHVFFTANSTLKPRIIISRNLSKSLNLPDLQETVLNLRESIFHEFYILAKIAGNGCTRDKPDIRYIYMYPYLSRYELFCLISNELIRTNKKLKEVVIRLL